MSNTVGVRWGWRNTRQKRRLVVCDVLDRSEVWAIRLYLQSFKKFGVLHFHSSFTFSIEDLYRHWLETSRATETVRLSRVLE